MYKDVKYIKDKLSWYDKVVDDSIFTSTTMKAMIASVKNHKDVSVLFSR